MPTTFLFSTLFYDADLTSHDEWAQLNADLEQDCLQIAEDDEAGQAWCEQNGYDGYTSYASLDDLQERSPAFAQLKALIDTHAPAFSADHAWDVDAARLEIDSFWINILNPLAAHSGHIHPNSVISGTYYVAIPPGAGRLKLEDPRLPMMMNAPALKKDSPIERQRFVYQTPSPGKLFMWESWLRHEVTPHQGEDLRISISFNYSLT